MADHAPLPDPPYYAVIFTAKRTSEDEEGYQRMATLMDRLGSEQPGYIGIESTRGPDGLGITVSYWQDLEAIQAWKDNLDHAAAREMGRRVWYSSYALRVARIEKAYSWASESIS
ncbi:MAG: antibiotic biosynthesis monooxygenase family protein [Magnetovibrionaceae bacterium]